MRLSWLHTSLWKFTPFFIVPGLHKEKGEDVTRVAGAVGVAVYLAYSMQSYPGTRTGENNFAVLVLGIYGFFALAALHASTYGWNRHLGRHGLTSVIDQVAFGALLYGAGHIALPFLFAPIGMSLAAGLRYGRACGIVATSASTFSVGAAFSLSPFWEPYHQLTTAFVVCM